MDRGIRTCSHWKRTLQHVPENSHLDAPSDTRKFFDVYYIFQDPIVDLKCMHRLPPHKGSSYSKLSTMSTKRTCRRANQSNDFVYQHHIEQGKQTDKSLLSPRTIVQFNRKSPKMIHFQAKRLSLTLYRGRNKSTLNRGTNELRPMSKETVEGSRITTFRTPKAWINKLNRKSNPEKFPDKCEQPKEIQPALQSSQTEQTEQTEQLEQPLRPQFEVPKETQRGYTRHYQVDRTAEKCRPWSPKAYNKNEIDLQIYRQASNCEH